MARYLISALLPALMFIGSAGPAAAQVRVPPFPDRAFRPVEGLSGTYVNTSNGRTCHVYRRGRDYVFINENGTPARFAFVGADRLELVSGDWNPDTVATVRRNRDGSIMLRFKEPRQPAGYWVKE
jgi:hypothetical protein